MTPRTAFLIVWGSILLGLAALVLLVVAVRKLRARLWAHAAAHLGLTVSHTPRPFTMEEAEANTLLRLCNADATGPSLRGQIDGIDAVVFQRHFVTKSGFHTATEYADETVAAFRCYPGKDTEFLLEARPSGEGKKEAEAEARPDFPRGYKVRTQQPESLRRLLTEDKLRFLEGLQERERWTFWAGGEWLLVYRPRRTAGVRQLRAFLQQARTIASALKG